MNNRMLRMILSLRGVLCLVGIMLLVSTQSSAQDSSETVSGALVAQSVEELKQKVIHLNTELHRLEQDLLFPASTRFSVFLSLNTGKFLKPDMVRLKLDDETVASHLYTQVQVEALRRGGIQRLHLGNLESGTHQATVFVEGIGPDNRTYKKAATLEFEKHTGIAALEVRIRDRSSDYQPDIALVLIDEPGGAGTAPVGEPPQRAYDTGYGMALYEYYQGNFLEALIRLDLANSEGGVAGHGDHPLLFEGGLMLGYGMTREAQMLFRALLDESDIPEEARNKAWFYLGKVTWLEGNAGASSDALDRVDGDLLKSTDETLYREWLYLKGQVLLGQVKTPENRHRLEDILEALPDQSHWRWYLGYNRAVQSLAAGDIQLAIEDLTGLIRQAVPKKDLPQDTADELSALEQQARLSLGRLHLQQGDFGSTLAVLDNIPLDGLLSDQALFDYAIAASLHGKTGVALGALESLQSRPLFTPWLQQAPYAMAFTIEQMNQPEAALDAYRKAAEHYFRLDQRLAREQSGLTEVRLVEALNLVPEDSVDQVLPRDFSLAELLAGDTFQLALRDVHELHRLESSLDHWQEQLASFDGELAGMSSDARRDKFAGRIERKTEELEQLGQRLETALDRTRNELMTMVETELASQRREIVGYLRASRHAQARLADRLFLSARAVSATGSSRQQSDDQEATYE